MDHPLSKPYDYQGTTFSDIQNGALPFTVANLIAHFELRKRAQDEQKTAFNAKEFDKKLDGFIERNDLLGLLKEFKLEDEFKRDVPDIEPHLHAIAVYSNIMLEGFGCHQTVNDFQIDSKFARDIISIGAQLEKLYGTDDKHCTVMHAVMQSANVGMASKAETIEGQKTLKNIKTVKWIVAQANATPANPVCVRILSYMHACGHGVERSLKKAVAVLEQNEGLNDPFIFYDLGLAYSGQMQPGVAIDKLTIPYDPVKAARFLQQAAELGHADAQRDLGLLITNRLINSNAAVIRMAELVAEKPKDAAKYDVLLKASYGMDMFKQAAEQGRVAAMYNLGRAYSGDKEYNDAAEKDLGEALHWLHQAADRGYPRANIEIASIYNRWFEETGTNDPVRCIAGAHSLYQFLLDRQTILLGTNVKPTVSTQRLTPEQLSLVRANLKKLEEEGRWDKLPSGQRQIIFDRDGTAATLVPFTHKDNPYAKDDTRDVEIEMARANDYATGSNGHIKRIAEALYIYTDIVKRRAGGTLALANDAQLKTIHAAIDTLAALAHDTLVQPDGHRTLIFYKSSTKVPEDMVFAGPSQKWLREQEKAAKKAAKTAGAATPERPDAKDKAAKPKGGNDKKGGPG
ncbi:MAG: sel1 repeat family protein [Alphaproteobacteria bacterium]|nr:sel1 repeat family protein [Alphaproteobacteria bacterium]